MYETQTIEKEKDYITIYYSETTETYITGDEIPYNHKYKFELY